MGGVNKDAALLFSGTGAAVSKFFIDFPMQKSYEDHAGRALKKLHPGIEKTPFLGLKSCRTDHRGGSNT